MERLRAGLCADCRYRQMVETDRSVFVLCRRGLTDPAYRKYPPLPVVACAGYDRERPEPDPSDPVNRDDKLSG